MLPPLPPLPTTDLEELLVRDAGRWRALAGARLFATGATGFFGLWWLSTVQQANRQLGTGIEVVALSRDPAAFAHRAPWLADDDAITLWRGDVRDFHPPAGPFDHLIHGATETSRAAAAAPGILADTLVRGTSHLLALARNWGVTRLLYLSSGAVYGEPPADLACIPESYLGAPASRAEGAAYGLGKRVGEHLCLAHGAASEVEVKIARGFSFVGPGMVLEGHFAIGNFIDDALHGRAITLRGDGSPVRSYLYAADLVSWLLAILVEGAAGGIYNVGSDQPVRLDELARWVATTVGNGGPPVVLRREVEHHHVRYVPEVRRAREELGLDVWTPLEEAIRRTAEWARPTLTPAVAREGTAATSRVDSPPASPPRTTR